MSTRTYIIFVIAITCASCATMANKINPSSVQSTRAIYSEAGGMVSILTGRVSSCDFVEPTGKNTKITKFLFAMGKCEIEIIPLTESESEPIQ